MTVKITFEDKGLSKVLENLKELNSLRLTIGFQGDKASTTYETGASVAEVAFFNEFGTLDIPARPFLRTSIFENRGEIGRLFAKELAPVAEGEKEPIPQMAIIGAAIVKIVQKRIDTSPSWAAPNAPSTIAKKGAGKPPLVESELMRNSVTYAVRKGGTIVAEGP